MTEKNSPATLRRDPRLETHQRRVPRIVFERAAGRSYPITLPACATAPKQEVEIVIRPVIKISLRVRDRVDTKMRRTAVDAQLNEIYQSVRTGQIELSHKDAVALSGEIYQLVVDQFELNPGEPRDWEAWKGFCWAAMQGGIPDPPTITWKKIMKERAKAIEAFGVDGGPVLLDIIENLPVGESEHSLEVRFGLLAEWVLARHRLEVTPRSRLTLLRQVAAASLQAGWQMKRAAEGDYRVDPDADRFGHFSSAAPRSDLTMLDLFERWRKEIRPAPSTVTTWKSVVASFQSSTDHEGLHNLSARDIIRWKDGLVGQQLSAKTINDTYLACVRTILNYGVRNQMISKNVAIGIKAGGKRVAGEGKLPYEDAELAKLLQLAQGQQRPARRWIPLLAACTGARAGELAQLWAERVREIDGVLSLDLKPAKDGGTFKNAGSERAVPVHPVLIKAGFIDYVREKRKGPLFYGHASEDGERHASKGTLNHLAAWIRKQPGFQDPRKDPMHAIRHWWKTTASRIGISDSMADYLQGHQTQGVSGRYRHHASNLEVLASEIARIPIPWEGSAGFD